MHSAVLAMFNSPRAEALFIKAALTILLIGVALIANHLLKTAANQQLAQGKIKRPTAALLRRLTNGFLVLIVTLGVTVVWGVNVENIWVSLTGVLALVAIGFIAVWSLLSNVVAGLLLVFAKPFRVEDRVRILPEGFEGEVGEISTFFVVLKLADGGTMYIPNNQVMQKAIVNLSTARQGASPAEEKDEGEA